MDYKIPKIVGFILLLCFTVSLSAQNYIISGYIRDIETKEVLVGSSIYDTEIKKGCTANDFGFYSLTLPRGKGIIRYSSLGYANMEINIDLAKDTVIQVYLTPVSEELKEIVISNATKLKDMRLGTINVSVQQIKNTPVKIVSVCLFLLYIFHRI
jgi:hypothetical protein